MTQGTAVIASVALLASVLVTALVRRYLVRERVLDIPNGRSAHSAPTPRGGGVSIVAVFLLAVLLLSQSGTISSNLGWALIGGGAAVAVVGWLDDRFRVPARWRLLIHFAAAGWGLWSLSGMGPLHLGWMVWDWGWVGQTLALFGLVWMINLYNFMDGIDGIAGLEGVCASGLGGALLAWSGLWGMAEGAWALAGASAGFLVWNWPPAKIFLGDVGSGFLGFVFGVLAIASAREHAWLVWPWLILLGVFVVDSTMTLLRRVFTGRCWYEAHCSHAYQHAARQWGSHARVTLSIAAINVVWLFPLAWGACRWPAFGPLLAVVALAPLAGLAWRYDAGRETRVMRTAGTEAECAVAGKAG